MSESKTPEMNASEAMLAQTFSAWRTEFRNILENHRREIRDRLEKIEREIEKKSDKENVDVLVRGIHTDLHRHTEAIDRLHRQVNGKVSTETMWKVIGLTLGISTAFGGLISYLLNVR